MKLSALMNAAGMAAPGKEANISSIVIDSRRVQPGAMFVAISGTVTDGHHFIGKAIDAGATAIVCEHMPEEIPASTVIIQVSDAANTAGLLADAFYDHPSSKLKLVGVTGTNGKTTTATLLYQLFTVMGYKAGLISTVENVIGTEVYPSTLTTPDQVTLHALMAQMVEKGCECVFMEVSSHAADQNRISGLHFAGGVFTNMSHDHLDYHHTFDAYIKAKKSFFDRLPAEAFALVNADDRRGDIMLQNTRAAKHTYSLRQSADFKGKILENTLEGLLMEIDNIQVHLRLIGEFNGSNAICAYGTAVLLGYDHTSVLTALSAVPGARGRFETLRHEGRRVLYVIDYAHTPDALEKVLRTILAMKQASASVITVVGCGGNRDRTKRPVMGRIASALSTECIFTSDNPRDEEPGDIINEMMEGVEATNKSKVLVITDRRQAIATTAKIARPGDIVLVAGKGHETYQEIRGQRLKFDDREVIQEITGG